MECSVRMKNNQVDFFTLIEKDFQDMLTDKSNWYNSVSCVWIRSIHMKSVLCFLLCEGNLRNYEQHLTVKGRVGMGTVQLG